MKAKLIALALGLLFSINSFSQGCWDSIAAPTFLFDTVGICFNDSVNLSLEVQGYHTYLWSTSETSDTISVDSAGAFWVTVTFDTCTWQSDTVNTIVLPEINPYIIANGPTEFCRGESVQLCVEPQPFASTLWCSGSVQPCIVVTETGDYCVTILDNNGCIEEADSVVSVIVYDPEPIIHKQGPFLYCGDTTFATYQWYLNGNAIPNSSSDSLLIFQCGNYSVEVVDSFGCTAHSDSYFACPPGINESTLIQSLTLYPNPTSGEVFLEFQLKNPSSVLLSITDILGKEAMNTSLSSQTQYRLPIDLQDLPQGIYTLQLLVGNERVSRPIVKQ